MKLTLRDLFWLVLLMAALTAWVVEHRRSDDLYERLRSEAVWLRKSHSRSINQVALARQEIARLYGQLTDQQLESRLVALRSPSMVGNSSDYELCLMEMARRGQSGPLEKHFETVMAANRAGRLYPRNLEALTALRRVQSQPDPLLIQLIVPHDQELHGQPAPVVQAKVTNVDAQRQVAYFMDDGSNLRGRRGRWKWILVDEQGRPVAESNDLALMAGGNSTLFELEFGQTGTWTNGFDLRKYVAPPRSGKYFLHVLYHNWVLIANEQDLSGLIVFQSEPVAITVTNPTDRWQLPAGFAFLMVLLCAGGLLLAIARGRGWRFTRGDLGWCGLIALAAVAAYGDCQYQTWRITPLLPDAQAEWSISRCPPGHQ